jgi:hypothetical protein
MTDIRAMGELNHEAALQRVVLALGTDAAREGAILEHMNFEARRQSKFGSTNFFMRPDIFQTDEMWGYARLARIAKRTGDEERSKAYLDRAISLCRSRHLSGPDAACTPDQMADWAARLSRRSEARELPGQARNFAP